MQLDLRGTNLETMQGYVERLGGVQQPDGRFSGDGWSVTLVAGVHRFRDWEFPRVVLTFEGDPGRFGPVVRSLRLWAMRGGA